MRGRLSIAGADEEVASRRVHRLLEDRPIGEQIAIGGAPAVELPAHVVEGAAAALSRRGYARSQGEPELTEAVADRLRSQGIEATSERILVTNGAMQALDVCFRTLLRPGDAVAMPVPGFFIGGLVRRAGGRLRTFPSPEGAGFRPDWDSAPAVIDRRTRLLFINSPVNPTGYVYDWADMEHALKLAEAHDLLLVSDESYSHFLYDGANRQYVSSLPGATERTILVRSFSKDYAMAAWRLGYMLMPPALVRPLVNAFEWSCLSVNRISQAAGLAAMAGPQDWVRRFVADAESKMRRVVEQINSLPGMTCLEAAGGMNLLVRFDGDAGQLAESLVVDAGIPAYPGEAFAAPGYFRLQFGADDANLALALERMRRVVEELSDA